MCAGVCILVTFIIPKKHAQGIKGRKLHKGTYNAKKHNYDCNLQLRLTLNLHKQNIYTIHLHIIIFIFMYALVAEAVFREPSYILL